jgi:hypothetical protein
MCGCDRAEPADREEGNLGDTGRRARDDQLVVIALGEVVQILHASDRRDRAGLRELVGNDVGDARSLTAASALDSEHLAGT